MQQPRLGASNLWKCSNKPLPTTTEKLILVNDAEGRGNSPIPISSHEALAVSPIDQTSALRGLILFIIGISPTVQVWKMIKRQQNHYFYTHYIIKRHNIISNDMWWIIASTNKLSLSSHSLHVNYLHRFRNDYTRCHPRRITTITMPTILSEIFHIKW